MYFFFHLSIPRFWAKAFLGYLSIGAGLSVVNGCSLPQRDIISNIWILLLCHEMHCRQKFHHYFIGIIRHHLENIIQDFWICLINVLISKWNVDLHIFGPAVFLCLDPDCREGTGHARTVSRINVFSSYWYKKFVDSKMRKEIRIP